MKKWQHSIAALPSDTVCSRLRNGPKRARRSGGYKKLQRSIAALPLVVVRSPSSANLEAAGTIARGALLAPQRANHNNDSIQFA